MPDLVAGRTIPEDIRDKASAAVDPHGFERPVKQLSRAADERSSQPDFVGAGRLADQSNQRSGAARYRALVIDEGEFALHGLPEERDAIRRECGIGSRDN